MRDVAESSTLPVLLLGGSTADQLDEVLARESEAGSDRRLVAG